MRKQQRQSPKFYFFHTGIKRALDRTLTVELAEGTYAFGEAFEHLVILNIARLCSYSVNDGALSYLHWPAMPLFAKDLFSRYEAQEELPAGNTENIPDAKPLRAHVHQQW